MVLRNEHVHMHTYEHTFSICIIYHLSQVIHLCITDAGHKICKHQLKMEGGLISLHEFHTSFLLLTPDMTLILLTFSFQVLILNARPSSSNFLSNIALPLLSFKYRLYSFFWQWIFTMNLAHHSVRVRLDIKDPQLLYWQTKEDQWGLTKQKVKY